MMMHREATYDVIIIGAGAAGLMCALTAGHRGKRVLVIDHAERPGKKIMSSGGGKCNFSNMEIAAKHYLSANPHFCKSAIGRFDVHEFLALIYAHEIDFEERDHGQLFCTGSAAQVVNMLLDECGQAGVTLRLNSSARIEKADQGFRVRVANQSLACHSLVVATGGLAYPKLGATDFGYRVAEQFGLSVIPPLPGLTGLLYSSSDRKRLEGLSGIALEAELKCGAVDFRGALLFTHRGISGPVTLQLSNYWQPGASVQVNLLPGIDLAALLTGEKRRHPKAEIRTLLAAHLPKRLIQAFLPSGTVKEKPIGEWKDVEVEALALQFQCWTFLPARAADFEKAEVTRGGVDVRAISSKTFEVKTVKGLYFIGEVLDVTGWLGGYNLHWAWASGHCAGQAV